MSWLVSSMSKKKGQKVTVLYFIATFSNFVLEIETSWATTMVNPFLKTKIVSDKC